MAVLYTIFAPLVWVMGAALDVLVSATHSVGTSILLLSVIVAVLMYPLQRSGVRAERRILSKMRIIHGEVKELKRIGLTGEALFDATDAVYSKYGFHPIHAVLAAAGFVAMLPILISSIILFQSTPTLLGQSFLFVPDLSQPDRLLGGISILPLVMFAISMSDAVLRYPGDPRAQGRFGIVSVVLLFLVFSMPAGLVLYWIGSNVVAFVSARMRPLNQKSDS